MQRKLRELVYQFVLAVLINAMAFSPALADLAMAARQAEAATTPATQQQSLAAPAAAVPPPVSAAQREEGAPVSVLSSAARNGESVTHGQKVQPPPEASRIGYIDAERRLKVRTQGGVSADWITVATDVSDFQIRDQRLGVLRLDGTLSVIDGPNVDAQLTPVDADVAAFQLGVSRVATLHKDGTFRLAEWGLVPQTVATGVKAFQLQTDRVGLLGFDGSFWVQEGTAADQYHKIADRVKTFQLDHEWIAYLQEAEGGTRLMLGRGQVRGMRFVEQARDVADFELEVWLDPAQQLESRARLATVDGGRRLAAGQGHLEPVIMEETFYNHFKVAQVPGVSPQSIHWAGGRLAVIDDSGELVVASLSKDGKLSGFQALGAAASDSGYSLTAEGTLLIRGASGELSARQVGAEAAAGSQLSVSKPDLLADAKSGALVFQATS